MGNRGDSGTPRTFTRRRFVRDGAGAAVAFTLAGPMGALGARRARRRVAVLGGGVGGLSAAHELAERGFDVTVYEWVALGGKARSVGVPGSARGGRRPLPGEHGMRFFPGFYTNLPDTLRRIPDGTNPDGVFDNLIAASQLALARDGGREEIVLPITNAPPRPWTLDGLRDALVGGVGALGSIPPQGSEYFAERLFVFMTSSNERRLGEWEQTSWWDFVAADRFSEDYRRVYVDSITRQILAAQAERVSARTMGLFWEAILNNLTGRTGTGSFDRVLDAPTNEAWIDPWERHLRSLGVHFRMGRRVERLVVREGQVVAAQARGPRGDELIEADWFVCAVPVERARKLFTRPLLRADPDLARTRNLVTDWMNAIQFYLRREVPVVDGHVLHIDSPWALSSLSQAQFWPERDFQRDYGDGSVRDCLSVDIGDLHTPGLLLGRPAKELRAHQIAREVWHQLKAHLNNDWNVRLQDSDLIRWHLDPSLVRRPGGGVRSREPLLINTPGSLADRPKAARKPKNLFLAADYVRVSVDIACMEGANEAARRAVNALLDRARSSAPRCAIHELFEPPELAAPKAADASLYEAGRPHALDRPPLG